MLCRHKAFTASTRKRTYSVTTKPSSPLLGKEYTLSPQSLHRFHPEKNILCRHKAFTASTRKGIYSVTTKPSPPPPPHGKEYRHKGFIASTRKRIYSVTTKPSAPPPGKEYTLSPQSFHRHHPERNILCHHNTFIVTTRKRIYILCHHKASTASTRKRIYTLSS